MAKYLEHFGSNVNAFRIRNNNNNNNNSYESKYGYYESDKRSEDTKRSSCSKSDQDEETSSHSSSIVVDEDSQPLNRDDTPPLEGLPLIHHHNNHSHNHHHHHHMSSSLFRPGVEPISPFSQKYHDFFLSPFLHGVTPITGLKRPLSEVDFSAREGHLGDQETPIDLSIKSKISRISSSDTGLSISGAVTADTERTNKKSPLVCEGEKKNPLDLSLLPPRCNPILG